MKEKQNVTPERLAELVGLARNGDQSAYTALYEATSQEVYRTVRSMVRSEETALDVQQDAYVFAFTHLDQLEDPAKFSPWLRSIAVNRTRSVLRKQTPVLFTELETEDGAEIPEVADLSPEASPEFRLERQETADYVREILDGLTVGQRMLVGMYYYEQLPVGKIAADLGVSPGTVKTQLFRSRKKIEAAVKRLEEKGVKLYGLTPLPFLVALLKKQAPAAEAGSKVLSGALTGSGAAVQTVSTVSAAAGAAAPAAEAAAIQVGRRFFETALGKLVLGVVAAGVIGGGAAGWRWYQNQVNYGDYRPPTETLELRLHADSAEDLTTEPTTEPTTTAPATHEDLTTDTSEPTETTEPVDPAGAGAHIGPDAADPSDPTAPTDPTDPTAPVGADAHIGPDATDPTDPTEPSEILGWRWQGDRNDVYSDVESVWEFDLPSNLARGKHIVVSVRGDAVPKLVTDRPDLISIRDYGDYIGVTTDWKPTEGVKEYEWYLDPEGVGSGHLYCTLNGETVLSSAFSCSEPPASFNGVSVQEIHNGSTWRTEYENECFTGEQYQLYFIVDGTAAPEFTTDNPNVVKLSDISFDTGSNWIHKSGRVRADIVGPGAANVYVTWKGEVQRAYSIHAIDEESDSGDSDAGLLAWYAGEEIDPKLISTGAGFDLYVKMIGKELPVLRTEDPAIAGVNSSPNRTNSVGHNRYEYWFLVTGVSVGETTLICEFHGEVIFTLPIKVTDGS